MISVYKSMFDLEMVEDAESKTRYLKQNFAEVRYPKEKRDDSFSSFMITAHDATKKLTRAGQPAQ